MSKKPIKVTNGKFVTVVKEEEAVVAINDGTSRLYIEERDLMVRAPQGVQIPDEYNGSRMMVSMRQGFDMPLLTLDKDDVMEDSLDEEGRLVPVTSLEEIEDLATEYRMQALSKHSKHLMNMLAGIALAVVSTALILTGSSIAKYAIVGAVGGAACFLLAGLLPFVRMISSISSKVVCDGYGNTVNLKTGECSLNGGCTLPIAED